MIRTALLSLPALTMAVIAFALFVVGKSVPVQSARVYGGTSEAVDRVALRLLLNEEYQGVVARLPGKAVRVQLKTPTESLDWSGVSDDSGTLEALFVLKSPSSQSYELEVSAGQPLRALARGRVTLSRKHWVGEGQAHGSWASNGPTPGLQVRVAPERGTFAAPFPDELRILVQRDGKPVPGASVSVQLDGAKLLAPVSATDARGRSSAHIAPFEHVVSATVEVNADGETGRFHRRLAIRVGAIHVERTGNKLTIRSPVPRERAFLSLLSLQQREFGAVVRLRADDAGGAVGSVSLPSVSGPLWAAVSSEADSQSMGFVAWPLHSSEPLEAPFNWDLRDHLLLNGASAARDESVRRRFRAKALAGGFSLVAGLLGWVLFLFGAKRAESRLREHMERSSLESDSATRTAPVQSLGFWGWLAMFLCFGLGFFLFALIGMMNMG
ncbi:MAG: Ig-like domain-containing protein [Polyangiaceae bacterium]|nr:Ig-like domain-containing protein [Polyangiaceae bacterium]